MLCILYATLLWWLVTDQFLKDTQGTFARINYPGRSLIFHHQAAAYGVQEEKDGALKPTGKGEQTRQAWHQRKKIKAQVLSLGLYIIAHYCPPSLLLSAYCIKAGCNWQLKFVPRIYAMCNKIPHRNFSMHLFWLGQFPFNYICSQKSNYFSRNWRC